MCNIFISKEYRAQTLTPAIIRNDYLTCKVNLYLFPRVKFSFEARRENCDDYNYFSICVVYTHRTSARFRRSAKELIVLFFFLRERKDASLEEKKNGIAQNEFSWHLRKKKE